MTIKHARGQAGGSVPGAYGTLWRYLRSQFLKNLNDGQVQNGNLLKFKETGLKIMQKTAKNSQTFKRIQNMMKFGAGCNVSD